MTKSIAVAMVAAIAFGPMAGGVSGSRQLQANAVYYLLTWEEKSHGCIAAAPVMLEECDGDTELAWVIVETQEEFHLEDGTKIGETSSSYAEFGRADEVQEQAVSDATMLVATTVAGAVGWELGTLIGTAAAPAIQAAVLSAGGSATWALALGALAPWIGGAAVAGGLVL